MQIKLLNDYAVIPTRGSKHAAGYDLYSTDNATIKSGSIAKLGTGIAMCIPEHFVGLIWERSKLASRYGIQIMGGVIDSDYRGEVMISVMNNGADFEVKRYDKIAQLVIQPIVTSEVMVVSELPDTERGTAGINSLELRLK